MKQVLILEGADSSGKSSLLKHIMEKTEGKCHCFHSNYNKSLPKENHKRQHNVITNCIIDLFKDKNYTGNNIIILDRCYISDITYGTIGYGSGGSFKEKIKFLKKLFKKILSLEDTTIIIIYCNPSTNSFNNNNNNKEELLVQSEFEDIVDIYNKFFHSPEFKDIIFSDDRFFYKEFDYTVDSDYCKLDQMLFPNKNTFLTTKEKKVKING